MVEGIDVSYHQALINWSQIPDRYKFAFIRTGDTMFEDPLFIQNWEGAKARGMLRGAYHYIRPSKSPEMQMGVIRAQVPSDDKGELPFVLDLEHLDSTVSKSQYRAFIEDFLLLADDWFDKPSIIYTGYNQWKDMLYNWWQPNDHPAWIEGHPLWISDPRYYRHANGHLVDNGKTEPRIAKGWNDWLFWQGSWVGEVPGIGGDVDLNLYNGSLEELLAYATPPEQLTLEQRLVRAEAWIRKHDPTVPW
jgi:lysozyme